MRLVSVLGAVLLASACAAAPDTVAPTPDTAAPAPEEQTPAGNPAGLLELEDGSLAWAGLVLGMSVEEAGAVLGRTLEPEPEVNDTGICEGVSATAEWGSRRISLSFVERNGEQILVTVFVEVDGWGLEDLVTGAKESVAGLKYTPSRHAPELAEAQNQKPLYVPSVQPEQGILISARGYMWVTEVRCLS